MKKLALLLFLNLLFSGGEILSQEFSPPVAYRISSDYGPRNWNGYKWHWGIDYASPLGTPVEAVEGGDIVYIKSSVDGNEAGWRIRTEGDFKYWTYMHLFYNGENPGNNQYEAAEVTLENSEDANDITIRYVFISWINKDSRITEKVLSYTEGNKEWHVRWKGSYLLDQTDSSITTQGYVSEREIIGPSGESGSAIGHPHLHLSVYRDTLYDINPLYYIRHDALGYLVNIVYPDPNIVQPESGMLYHIPGAAPAAQTGERIRFNVNSSNSDALKRGLDLDRVKFYLLDPNQFPPVYDQSTLAGDISYGGAPPGSDDNIPSPAYISQNGDANRGSFTRTGVDPLGGAGYDDLYLVGFNTRVNTYGLADARLSSEARFPDGPYTLSANAYPIRSETPFVAEKTVAVNNFRPYTEQVLITEASTGEPVYERAWTFEDGLLKSPRPTTDLAFAPGQNYNITATFSEYMREASVALGTGEPISMAAVELPLEHKTKFTTGLTIPADITEDTVLQLPIGGLDSVTTDILRLEPTTKVIDPATQLTRNSLGQLQGESGTDRLHAARVNVVSPIVTYQKVGGNTYRYDCKGNDPELCGTPDEPVNIATNTIPFIFTDIGAGIERITIRRNDLEGEIVYTHPFALGVYVAPHPIMLEDGVYAQVVTDNMGLG